MSKFSVDRETKIISAILFITALSLVGAYYLDRQYLRARELNTAYEALLDELEATVSEMKLIKNWKVSLFRGPVVAVCYSVKINRPEYSPFDYYYEYKDGMWPDYGFGGITLASIEYED